MKRVALYARVSSDQQADKHISIPSQLRLLREHAAKLGMTIYHEYVDEGESALSANRPAFLNMIRDAKVSPSRFQTILVWKLSRFARNRQDSILYKSMLKKHGVEVISISEPIDNTPQGQLLEGMIEVIDEFYSAALAQETLRGMIENARGGYRNGGLPVFGYRNVRAADGNGNQKTRYEIEEGEAQIVRKIFELFAKGNGLKNIVMHLNAHEHKPRSGRLWSKATIATILRNEAYIGWTVFNKKDTKTYGAQFKPRDEWIIIRNTHPPIVTEQLFNRVQSLIAERHPTRTAPRVSSSAYLLSGLMTCERCGSAFGVTGYGRGKKYAYYNCLAYARQGKQVCPGRSIRADELDALVISKVRERLFSEFNIRQLLKDLNAATRTLKDGRGEKVKELKRRLADKEARLQRLYEAIETGKVDLSLIGDRLRALKAEQNALQEELAGCEQQALVAPPVVTRAVIAQYRQEMEQVFIGENVQEQRAFLKNFIEKIIVGDAETKIVYYAGGIRLPSGTF